MYKNYHCEFSNTMPFIVSSHSFPFLFSEIFCTVTLRRNLRAESLTWKENFQVCRLQRKSTTQTFNRRYANGIRVLVDFFSSLTGTNKQEKKQTTDFIIENPERWKLTFSFSVMNGGVFQSPPSESMHVLELEKLNIPNIEVCSSLMPWNLWDTVSKDSNAAIYYLQQLPKYCPSRSLYYKDVFHLH